MYVRCLTDNVQKLDDYLRLKTSYDHCYYFSLNLAESNLFIYISFLAVCVCVRYEIGFWLGAA